MVGLEALSLQSLLDRFLRYVRIDTQANEAATSYPSTPGQLALAWVLAQGDDVAPIPGTKRIPYLEENVGATEVRLSDDDLKALVDAVPREAVVGDRHVDMSSVNA